MGRQEKRRAVECPPRVFRFGPESNSARLDEYPEDKYVVMSLDEFEAVRLADKLDYDHTQASEIMGISRPTFTRLISRARQKVAEFIVGGKSLEISGGSILFSEDVYCCRHCQRPFKWEGEGDPQCPVCIEGRIIKARGDCNGDCCCCDTNSDE